ncbi:MAG: hypothetical protein A3D28_00435 [Omnitrophica bacterium RIFCSPHIGHO2_02_FULL_63_14]|nr:MAG: hypothetical protein A3D28_00435 [Omnitrophica bacterium RIFCSPHIGHO2_02_FULL_63_14]
MTEELSVLKTVCGVLAKQGIPYMVTGSIASSFYAVPRMTRDIDIVLQVTAADVDRIVNLFKKDFYIDRESVDEAVRRQDMFNLIHNKKVVKVDFIVRKDEPYRKLEFERRRQVELGGATVWMVSPEDLILSKLWWAKDSRSEMQLTDVQNLLRAIKLDRDYLLKWVRALNLEDIYELAKK